jgi:glucose-1-phosphate thymidylyltransferase
VLAAGYATRLRPLTDQVAKPLLPLAGRPMLDYLYDRIAEVGAVDELHVVTNSRFAADFRDWAESGGRP